MFTNPFLQNFFAYSQQNPWAMQSQPPTPQGMPPYQMPMMQPPVEQMGGLLGKATNVASGKLPPAPGKIKNPGGVVMHPYAMAVRG